VLPPALVCGGAILAIALAAAVFPTAGAFPLLAPPAVVVMTAPPAVEAATVETAAAADLTDEMEVAVTLRCCFCGCSGRFVGSVTVVDWWTGFMVSVVRVVVAPAPAIAGGTVALPAAVVTAETAAAGGVCCSCEPIGTTDTAAADDETADAFDALAAPTDALAAATARAGDLEIAAIDAETPPAAVVAVGTAPVPPEAPSVLSRPRTRHLGNNKTPDRAARLIQGGKSARWLSGSRTIRSAVS
jgi:hypothetical protein